MFIKVKKNWATGFVCNELSFKALGVFGLLLFRTRRGFWSGTVGELASRSGLDSDLLEVLILSAAWRFGLEVKEIKPYRRTYEFFFRCPEDYDCLDASQFEMMDCEDIGKAMVDGSLVLDKESLLWYDKSLLDGRPESFRKWVERLTLDKLTCSRQEVILKTIKKGWIDVQN